ncbi:phosphoglycerate dehydrogenase [Brucella endophytica]|uniref:Phosphoglycerate dehydrogenase n=1 Tax=Brucella endophytica TaxID=1963359 RepID=A0A916WCM9_9HYPH|nr:2-hydroxyacid dehydrogenase [Brucella endophytica]GGA86073.1 phosphoglycerate dehydrogenase [Brucella endophytica]
MINIAFHGSTTASYHDDFRNFLQSDARVSLLPDELRDHADIAAFENADVIIGNRFTASMPTPLRLKLYHVSATGYDRIDFAALASSVMVCNCFGHEQGIAEYVMAAILGTRIPLQMADAGLRQGKWLFRSASVATAHGEIGGLTVGLLGYGHIGKAIARRARAFNMRVLAANRSAVAVGENVDAYFSLADLDDFYGAADFIVVSLPLSDETRGFVGERAFSRMRKSATVINVGRGPVINEQALYDALAARSIGGAVIDTWYQYPGDDEAIRPSRLPFENLDNILMTPHMSGWTNGTIRRRAQTMASNIDAYFSGGICTNIIREPERTDAA